METTARFGAIPRTALLLAVLGVMLAFVGALAGGASSPAPADPSVSVRGTGAFAPGPALADSRVSHTATLLADGRVLVAGGYDEGDATAELFDPETGTFAPAGGLARPRHYHTETLLPDGRVLLVGGQDQGSAETWDPRTGSVRPVGALTEDRANHSATLLDDGRVLIAGGHDSPAMTELFDPGADTFQPGPSLAHARAHHRAVRLSDGRVLIVGGPAAAEIWDPVTETFQPAGELREARWYPTATLLEGDRVLVIGGGSGEAFGEGDGPLASAELWDPATMTFSPAGEMGEPRLHHTATLVPDGRVLVIGSGGPDQPLASAELWDPATATFGPGPSLAQARGGHAATLLDDGRVLVTGGYGPGEVSLASTEIWDPLLLTAASAGRDWPGPLRAEPAGDAIVVPAQRITEAGGGWGDQYLDEPDGGDLAASPWLDIVEVGTSDSRATYVHLAAIPESADPAEHRRAYGVVVDTDLDGVADYRVGMENAPGGEYRLWRTNLRTGETIAGAGAPYVPMGDSLPDASYPGDEWFEQGLSMTRPVRGVAGPYRFYAWSSEIADGRIVASDYAPDAGWLEPSL